MLGLGTSINKSSSSESAFIAGRSSSFTGLLDESYGGSASAAYSVRRLSSSYSGKALQIRRVSDNVEVDVSFDNNNEISLDSAVTNVTEETTGSSTSIITGAVNLGEFVANASYTDADSLGSTDSAKVQCWYDQSGSSNDATQNTAGSQPTIVSSGALETENGKPIIRNNGSNTMALPFNDQAYKLYSVFNGEGQNILLAPTYLLVAQSGRTSSPIYSGFTVNDIRKNGSNITIPATWGDAFTAYASQNLSYFDIDIASASNLQLGFQGGANYPMYSMQEIIFYPDSSTHTISDIETNINTFYNIYS
tara:strand:+ start:764 stop:1684 length:921 start_codon:yes stop_codon:yes gene_type:complete